MRITIKKAEKRKIKNSISLILLFLSITIILVVYWYKNTFSDVGFEQLLFHLKVPLDGTNDDLLVQFLDYSKSYIIFFLIIFFIILFYHSNLFNHKYIINFKFKLGKINKERRITINDDRKYIFRFNIILFIITLIYVFISLDMKNFIYDEINTTSIYEKYYVDPSTAELEFPENKQNLIYIYLESMESTYSNLDSSIVNKSNLIPNLEKIANDNINFSNTNSLGGAYALTGTTWTIAAMVAQTSGLPLKIPIDGNLMSDYSSFLPGAYSLGDILKKEGYNQLLLLGSDSKFGGRSNYFKQYGNYEIYDYYSAIEDGKIDEDYYVWWGLEDQKLFDYAKEKLIDLSNIDGPFNFTMLTVDTHFLEGYKDDSCEDITNNEYADAVLCSDKKVSSFISWIKDQDFYENTTIIISGDHLLMGNYLFEEDYEGKRTVYNAIINSRVSADNTKNRKFTTLDMFPTTLASLGVEIKGDRLGLGTNLFSNKRTLTEELGYQNFDDEISKNSNFYNKKLLSTGGK